jgi:hypothetical protein
VVSNGGGNRLIDSLFFPEVVAHPLKHLRVSFGWIPFRELWNEQVGVGGDEGLLIAAVEGLDVGGNTLALRRIGKRDRGRPL